MAITTLWQNSGVETFASEVRELRKDIYKRFAPPAWDEEAEDLRLAMKLACTLLCKNRPALVRDMQSLADDQVPNPRIFFRDMRRRLEDFAAFLKYGEIRCTLAGFGVDEGD
jgi:hypothetical protein